tara:strand:- start:58 stop:912 length:855 start_codon:yes stop_codon:yes gene_type:complete
LNKKIKKDNFRSYVFKKAVQSRAFDQNVFDLIKKKIINFPVYLSSGQEYVAASIAGICRINGIKPHLFGQHRGHSVYISFGGNLELLIREMLGFEDGCTYGMGGSLSIHSKDIGMYGHDGFMGSNAPIGVGSCLASKKPTVIFLGDAALEEDYVLASLSWVAKKNLPILFVIEDNDFAVLTKKSDRRDWKAKDLANAFKIKSYDTKDDPNKIYDLMKDYKFKEPRLINVRTNRLYWHSGAGIDKDNIFDRLKSEEKKLGVTANKIYKQTFKKINKLWQMNLEKL